MSQLQANTDSPDLSQLQRRLLPEELALVPRYCTPIGLRFGIHERLLCLRERSFMFIPPNGRFTTRGRHTRRSKAAIQNRSRRPTNLTVTTLRSSGTIAFRVSRRFAVRSADGSSSP